jgi:cysteine-rich repeat protein
VTGCGNGILTGDEQCDDGNTESGDCCDDTCHSEPDGSVCEDGDICTADRCDGAGSCVGVPLCGEGELAIDGEQCTLSPSGPCGLFPVADTHIQEGEEATWDHGKARKLVIEDDDDPRAILYLKFDLSNVTARITRARLRLFCTSDSPDGGTVYPVGDSRWVEGVHDGDDEESAFGPGLKWIDVDSDGDGDIGAAERSPYAPDFATPVAVLGAVTEEISYTLDVTAVFQAGVGLYTLAMANEDNDSAKYASREHRTASERPLVFLELEPCGNGRLDADEECDDGNTADGDGCDSNCTVTGCGNGVVTVGEECDAGAPGASCCSAECTLLAGCCGNGKQENGEDCDDGNASDGDCCSSACQVVVPCCGNGIRETDGETDEECDDAGESPDCDGDCTTAICGDGTVNRSAGEVCDPGTLDSTTGQAAGRCQSDCTLDCCESHDAPGCDASVCERCVCALDPGCCSGAWDGFCVTKAKTACGGACLCGRCSGFPDCALPPVGDTYIEGPKLSQVLNCEPKRCEASWDHGARTRFDVSGVDDGHATGIGYLKFDLSGLTTPITRARLRLFCTNYSGNGGDVYALEDSSWVEGSCHGGNEECACDNQCCEEDSPLRFICVDTNANGVVDPSDDSPFLPFFTQAPVAKLGEVFEGRPRIVDVTSAFQDGPGVYSLAIYQDETTNGSTYATREHLDVGKRPLLELTLGCGDGTVGPGEECDDGNLVDADGCDSNCTITKCGNGILTPTTGEECDDGNTLDGDCCTSACVVAVPDGTPCAEDGNECTEDVCQGGLCNLGVADGTSCDDGALCTVNDTCQAGTCAGERIAPCCGNGIIESNEECDDRNAVDGDCCSSRCRTEPAGAICRPAGGVCDVAEACDGETPECPPDSKKTEVCRPPVTSFCDVAETCDGVSDDCPADRLRDDGTPCEDKDVCTIETTCEAGECRGVQLCEVTVESAEKGARFTKGETAFKVTCEVDTTRLPVPDGLLTCSAAAFLSEGSEGETASQKTKRRKRKKAVVSCPESVQQGEMVTNAASRRVKTKGKQKAKTKLRLRFNRRVKKLRKQDPCRTSVRANVCTSLEFSNGQTITTQDAAEIARTGRLPAACR